MAKKRTFSSRNRGQDVFWGGRRPEYSFPDTEDRQGRAGKERAKTGGRDSSEGPKRKDRARSARNGARGMSSPPAQSQPKRKTSPRGPDLPRQHPARNSRKGPSFRTALVLISVAVVVILLVLFIFVLPSPIKSLNPKSGSTAPANSSIKVEVKNGLKKGDFTLAVDGRDVTGIASIQGKTITCNASLPDGKHNARFVLKGSGFMGTRSAEWAFSVDATPPKLEINKKVVREVKDSPGKATVEIAGTTDAETKVTLAGQPLSVAKNGAFSGTADATRSRSVELVAWDEAGNSTKAFVVTQKKPDAKGAHVSIYMASSDSDLTKMIGLTQRTELNALEIDLKDEAGMVGFALDYPLAKQAGAVNDLIKLDAVVDKLRYNGVYTICRIVTFKDPKLAKARPDLTVHNKSGAPWGTGAWLDPYSKDVWDYNMAAAEAAAKAGFNEVQFDYVRFPSDGDTSTCVYPHQDTRNPKQVISGFLSYARERLAPYNLFVSADLFGLTASSQGEMGIGQNVPAIAQKVDYISPMVYPSHYHLGEYNIKVPENNPGDTVSRSLQDFLKETKGTGASLRPWLQDFSLKVRYTPDMVRAQIDATEKAGVREWLLWDPDCTYSESALKPKKAPASTPTKT